MDQQQQREVARGLRDGEPEAWQTLYETYAGRVWEWAARLMGPRSGDVADVVQETFLAAARSARKYDATRGSLWLWLCGIARNHVALYFRKRKRHERLPDADDGQPKGNEQVIRWLDGHQEAPEEALAAKELAASVRAVLGELPADYGALLAAKYCDGASIEEIAGQHGCSPTAVRSKLARARRAFRRAFARTGPISSDSQASARHES